MLIKVIRCVDVHIFLTINVLDCITFVSILIVLITEVIRIKHKEFFLFTGCTQIMQMKYDEENCGLYIKLLDKCIGHPVSFIVCWLWYSNSFIFF